MISLESNYLIFLRDIYFSCFHWLTHALTDKIPNFTVPELSNTFIFIGSCQTFRSGWVSSFVVHNFWLSKSWDSWALIASALNSKLDLACEIVVPVGQSLSQVLCFDGLSIFGVFLQGFHGQKSIRVNVPFTTKIFVSVTKMEISWLIVNKTLNFNIGRSIPDLIVTSVCWSRFLISFISVNSQMIWNSFRKTQKHFYKMSGMKKRYIYLLYFLWFNM